MAGKIHIGTSGWQYDHWAGNFYPEKMDENSKLKFYKNEFDTVELNNSFYQIPKEDSIKKWVEVTPDDFFFSVKASRYITHMKKLKDPGQPLRNFFDKIDTFGHKLGPVLFQLPPNWNYNIERLENFLKALGNGGRFVFEFRDKTWFNDDVYDLLREHNAAFCIYDLDSEMSPKEITADFIYVRLHGPDGPYRGKYDTDALSGWAGAFHTWSEKVSDIYCYFDNDQNAYAVENAKELKVMTENFAV